MNKQLYLIILLLTCRICMAQNLVPNGDFELYSSCPTALHQLDSALFWMNPTIGYPGGSTPDYFNQCGTTPAGVPYNTLGFQQANSGNGYSGIAVFTGPPFFLNQREYAEVSLTSTLVANTCYHFQMYVNRANKCRYAVSDIGVYFSDTIVAGINNFNPLPFTPQINNSTGYMTDSLNWILISGNYTALGSENYLIIGNFKDDTNTDTILLDNSALLNEAYLYIDDVSLVQIPPCNTGINEQNGKSYVNIYPNPLTDKLNITNSSNELSEIILYDIVSRILLQQAFTNSVSLNTEQLAKGLYLYEVRNKNGMIKKGKVVKD